MIRAPTSTAGKARIKIWTDCFLNIYQSELKELSNMSGGRNIKSIPCGFISEICLIDSPMTPVF